VVVIVVSSLALDKLPAQASLHKMPAQARVCARMAVMPAIEPLNECEEFAWRALSRLIVVAPRLLDDDLQRDAQMGLSEYTVLVHLSEAPDSTLRVAQLADLAYLSGSRVTRLVDQLALEGLVEKDVPSTIVAVSRSGSPKRG